MKIIRFEELDCWKEARELVKMIYGLTKKTALSRDYRLRDQITGAGISIMNNIAEGFDSQSNKEFVRFLRIGRRSVSEAENCLYIAIDQKYITEEEFKRTFEQGEKGRRLIDGLIRYLRKHRTNKTNKTSSTNKGDD